MRRLWHSHFVFSEFADYRDRSRSEQRLAIWEQRYAIWEQRYAIWLPGAQADFDKVMEEAVARIRKVRILDSRDHDLTAAEHSRVGHEDALPPRTYRHLQPPPLARESGLRDVELCPRRKVRIVFGSSARPSKAPRTS